jgi:hypothetical protein
MAVQKPERNSSSARGNIKFKLTFFMHPIHCNGIGCINFINNILKLINGQIRI